MLVVTRKKDEKLIIGDGIEVQVLRIGRENVRLGIKAPAHISIYREEIYDAIKSREHAAAQAAVAGVAQDVQADAQVAGSELPEAEQPAPPKAKAKSEG